MKNNSFKYHSLPNMTVGMQCQEERNLQVLHGKAILNEDDRSFLFFQNSPRGPRSNELFRTRHSRLVQTPKCTFTLTFRFSYNEKNLQSSLMSEMESIISNILNAGKEAEDEI